MSGRIASDRDGYNGYECEGIDILVIDCIDCELGGGGSDGGNGYNKIPIECEGVVETTEWTDYREYADESETTRVIPTTTIARTYTYDCTEGEDTTFDQGFLDVEYPDVPPVSVRGISLKYKSGAGAIPEPAETCIACIEKNISAVMANSYVYYRDQNGTEVKVGLATDTLTEPIVRNSDVVHEDYLDECSSLYDSDDYPNGIFKSVKFIDCNCSNVSSLIELQVVTSVEISGNQLIYNYHTLHFDGGRLVDIDDDNVCLGQALLPDSNLIVGLSDCP